LIDHRLREALTAVAPANDQDAGGGLDSLIRHEYTCITRSRSMTASCLSAPLASSRRAPLRRRAGIAPGGVLAIASAATVLFLALVVAPEQPQAQAEICERHNGAAACRIW